MQKQNILIAGTFLLLGFFLAYLLLPNDKGVEMSMENDPPERTVVGGIVNKRLFDVSDAHQDYNRLDNLQQEITQIKQQLQQMQADLRGLTAVPDQQTSRTLPATSNNSPFSSMLNRRLFNINSLVRGGIEPGLAEDIVRRKNSYELKRLQLQDREKRDNYPNTQRYFDELEAINREDVNLRDELGEQRYDEYLYASKQNNRIKISSVMLGSNAEQAGIQAGDVVLSYDNQRMFSWQELKAATTEGELGEYVSISIYRNGEIFSFSVPRGPLGMQLGATRLEP